MATLSFEQFLQHAGGTAQDVQVQSATPQPTQDTGGGAGGSMSDAFQGGVSQMKQGYDIAANAKTPVGKLAGGMKEIAGGIGAVLSPLAPATDLVTKPIGSAINAVADTVSNNPSVQKFAMSDSGKATADLASFLSDTSTVVGTVGALKAPLPKVSVPNAVGSVARGTGRVLKNAGEGAYGLTVVPGAGTAKALLNYDAKQPSLLGRIKNMFTGDSVGTKPVTEANTAARAGITGTEYGLGVKAKQITTNLWDKVISPELDASKVRVDMRNFLSDVGKEIGKVSDLTRRGVLKNALDAVKADYKNVSAVSLKKLQDYKAGWAEFLPDATYAGKPIAAGLKEIHNLMADKARTLIHKNITPKASQAYYDYGNLQSIIKSAEKSLTGDPATKSLSRDVWQFVMNKAITPVATIGGKILYKTGEGLELVGKSGAKTVGDVITTHSLPVTGTSNTTNVPLIKYLQNDRKMTNYVKNIPVKGKSVEKSIQTRNAYTPPNKLPVIQMGSKKPTKVYGAVIK